MKKILVAAIVLTAFQTSQAQTLKSILGGVKEHLENSVKNHSTTGGTSTTTPFTSTTNQPSTSILGSNLTNSTIASGLKEALSIGLNEGISTLGTKNGFYNSPVAKILMPQELQNVEKTLRAFGLGSLADKGVKLLNNAAENAVKEAAPIFVNAVTSMTITDAKDILLGGNNAATSYLQTKTTESLTSAFKPKVEASLQNVGADKVWKQMITKYNTFSGKKVTTDLNAYVTEQAINGVFKMVADKEAGIRNNSALQTTSILQQVFGGLK